MLIHNKRNIKTICFTALGKPVIEINVDDDQLEDRLDEGTLQYFAQYHYDGIQRTYLKYQYTQTDKDRMTMILVNLSQRIVLLHHGKKATIF